MIAEIKTELTQILVDIGYTAERIYGKPKAGNLEKEHAVISVIKEKFNRQGQVLETNIEGEDNIQDTSLDYNRTMRLVIGLVSENENDTSNRVNLFLSKLPQSIPGVNNTSISIEAIDGEYINHSNNIKGVVGAWLLVEATGEVRNTRVRDTGVLVDHETIIDN